MGLCRAVCCLRFPDEQSIKQKQKLSPPVGGVFTRALGKHASFSIKLGKLALLIVTIVWKGKQTDLR